MKKGSKITLCELSEWIMSRGGEDIFDNISDILDEESGIGSYAATTEEKDYYLEFEVIIFKKNEFGFCDTIIKITEKTSGEWDL